MITDFKILFETPLKPIMLEKVQFLLILLASPPPQTFAIITNVNDKEIFIIEEFCHYKNQGWFRPLTNLEWLHFPSLQMGTKPRRLGGRCWVVYPLLTRRSCRTSLALIGSIDSQVFVFWDSKTITLWSA